MIESIVYKVLGHPLSTLLDLFDIYGHVDMFSINVMFAEV